MLPLPIYNIKLVIFIGGIMIMIRKIALLIVFAVAASGSLFAQVRFWWWGRAQITPYERHWDTSEEGNQVQGHMNSYIWWSRFGILANHGGTIGFDSETATMLLNTNEPGDQSFLGGFWASWADFWSYSMWYKPLDWLLIRVGKWNYVQEGSAWVMEFFDRTRYSMNGIGEDEFFAGYDNMVQYIPGTNSGGGGNLRAGTLFEGYFGPLTASINLKSIDPTMKHTDYLQTIQVGARYDVPGIGFFRLQMIGFDPKGNVTGNFYMVDQATSQIQAAANITGFPGMEFRLGLHYYLSKSNTNWTDSLNADYNFSSDKNAVSIPLGLEMTMFNPISFRVVGNMQFGKDPIYGKNITMFKAAGQVKYVVDSYLTALLNVSSYNLGKGIFSSVEGTETVYKFRPRDPVVDVGLGIQLTNIRGGNIQTGLILQFHTADDTQVGIAIPFTFDFGF